MATSKFFSVTISARTLVADWSTLPEGVDYIRGQLELGESTGYAHWQLMVVTRNKNRPSFLKRIWPSAHIESSRSAALRDYVWKDDTAVDGSRFELGVEPQRRQRRELQRRGHDWEAIYASARIGDLAAIPAHVRVTSYNVLKRIRADHLEPVGQTKTVKVFYGAPGTGKSRQAWEEAGFSAYPKDPRSKFWDGYQEHENVVIDEFRGGIDIAHMLRWLDRYPVIVEVKGASVCLAAKNIWITSNLHPKDWYPGLDEDTLGALLRRLEVTRFASL